MIGPDRLARVSAEAVVPEQVVAYVRAVAGSSPRMIESCVGYAFNDNLVLIGYPLHDPFDTAAMARAVDRSLAIPGLQKITVVGPARPPQAPAGAGIREDAYQMVNLPVPPPGPKLRNLLRRAGRELSIDRGRELGEDHLALVRHYLDKRPLSAGTRHIYAAIPDYLSASPTSRVVSARRADGQLAAFGVGEYVSLHTAFFVFCFRDPQSAPPGSADLVLANLLAEAAARGQTRMNLGLGVSAGIRFFKQKWGSDLLLPCVEVSWNVRPAHRGGRWRGLFGKARKGRGELMKMKPPVETGKVFREPGIWESLREMLLGVPRPFDCVQVEVTSRCSGRCSYCPQTALGESWQGRDLKMETFARLWPLMRRAGRVHLQGWGEPLLNGAFFDMAALARRAGCSVSTTTCGLRMDASMARRMVDSGMDIVAFSLAGTDAASNASRIGVDFAQVCAAVAELQRERKARNAVYLEIHFAYLLLASQVAAVRGLPALMERLGVHAAVVSTLDYLPRPDLAAEAFFPVDSGKLAPVASVLAETAGEARRRGLDFHYTLPGAAASGNRCRENVLRSLFVGADGSVSPCVYLNVPAGAAPQRRVFGNLDDQDPLAIWEGQGFRRFREGLAAGKPDAACRACPKRFFS